MHRGERREIQERPQKPYADSIKDKMDQTTMTTESNSTEDQMVTPRMQSLE